MRRIFVGLLAVLWVIGFAMVSTPQGTAQPAVSKVPKRLIWMTMPPGSSHYFTAVGITQLVNQYTELKVILHPYPVQVAMGRALHQKQVDLGDAQVSNSHCYTYGIKTVIFPEVEESWPEFRLLMHTNVMWWGWLTRPDTGIKTIADLRGRTINYEVKGQLHKTHSAIDTLRVQGIDPVKDVKHVYVDSSMAAMKGLQLKKLEAVFVPYSGAAFEELRVTTGVVILPVPPETFDAFRPEVKMGSVLRELPAGYLGGLDKQQFILGIPKCLIARDDLDDQAAYLVVKAIMEHARELDRVAPEFKEWGNKEYALPADFLIPVHPGALKYYKETGMWTPAHEGRQRERLAKLPK